MKNGPPIATEAAGRGGGGAELAVNTWLQRVVRLALPSLARRIDREQGNRPFFWFNLEATVPCLQHDYWDFCDMSGRWVDAFILGRLMTGVQIGDAEQVMKEYMLKHQREDGLFYNDPCQTAAVIKIGNIPPGAFADMLCQSRVMMGLVSWYLEEPTTNLEERIERLLNGLKRAYVWEGRSCRAPALRWLEEGEWQRDGGFEEVAPGYAAMITPMIMRYYEATGSPVALQVAEGLVRGFVLDRSRYGADGTYAGNTHWGGGCLGPAGAVRLARATGDEELLALGERIFEHIMSFSFDCGWMPESINVPEKGDFYPTCEVCNLTDAIHLAMQLTDAGVGDHWDFIDRTIRNQVIEQQFRHPEILISSEMAEQSEQPIMEVLRGTVESVGYPNTLAVNRRGIEACCTAAAIRACYFAWQRGIEEKNNRVWIHLPFSRSSRALEVLCHEPWHGAVTLKIHQACKVSFRLGRWMDKDEMQVTRNGKAWGKSFAGKYLLLDDLSAGDVVGITYPLEERESRYSLEQTATYNEQAMSEYPPPDGEYRALWRGGTVVEMTPAGKPYPIYQRKDRLEEIPEGPVELGEKSSPVFW